MKFLILSQFAGSAKHGMVLRNYNWGRELVALGHDVTIVASSFAHSRNFQPETQGNVTEEIIDGIRYLWIKGITYKPENYLMRIAAMLQFTCKALFLRKALLQNAGIDVVIASSPQPFVIYPAYCHARGFKAKLVFDVRDLWPLSIRQLGNVTNRNPLIWLMQRAENFACRKCDVLTSVPKRAEAYFRGHGLADGKFMHIGNGIASLDEEPDALPVYHAKALKLIKEQGGFIVGYAGALGKANALHALIAALGKIPGNTHAVLLGTGPYKDDLLAQVQALSLQARVHFLPPIPSGAVGAFLYEIDAAYIGLSKYDLIQYGVSPTKLNDYMLAVKPVVYAVGDAENAVEQSGCGISCEAENSAEIARAITRLSNLTPAERTQMGEAGKRWLFENNLVSVQMKKLVERITSLSTT